MRVYVAGSSADLDFVRFVMDEVEAAGMEVTHDWVSIIRARGEANPEGDSIAFAEQDLEGVEDADAVLLVAKSPTIGAWVEMGFALALNTPVVVLVTGHLPTTIFLSLAEEVVSNVTMAVEALLEIKEDVDE